MATYNQGKFIADAIGSVLKQTHEDWELLIGNDGSTDDTQNIIEDIAETDERIKVFECYNFGASETRNILINEAEGDYILPLDGDDMITSIYLEKGVDVLEENPSIAFVYPDTIYFGSIYQRHTQPEYSFWNLVTKGNFMSYCSLFRAKVLGKAPYNEKNRNYMEDFELYIKLGAKGHYGKHIPEPLFFYRSHEDSSTKTEEAKKFWNIYHAHLITWYPEVHPPELFEKAKKMIDGLPSNFMEIKRKEQGEYL